MTKMRWLHSVLDLCQIAISRKLIGCSSISRLDERVVMNATAEKAESFVPSLP